MLKVKFGVLGVSLLIGLSGCQSVSLSQKQSAPAISTASLQAHDWQLVSVTDKAGKPVLSELFYQKDKPLIVRFDDTQVRFFHTCNRLWGDYRLEENRLVLGAMAATRMMCEPELMRVDTLAPQTLTGVVQLQTSGKETVLTFSDDEKISRFVAAPKIAP